MHPKPFQNGAQDRTTWNPEGSSSKKLEKCKNEERSMVLVWLLLPWVGGVSNIKGKIDNHRFDNLLKMWCNFEYDFKMIFVDLWGHLGTIDTFWLLGPPGEFASTPRHDFWCPFAPKIRYNLLQSQWKKWIQLFIDFISENDSKHIPKLTPKWSSRCLETDFEAEVAKV